MNARLFAHVETFFSKLIYKKSADKELDHMNICCEEEEKRFLMRMGEKIHEIHGEITLKDIYITLIYTYYALNLSEQTSDVLKMNYLLNFADNFRHVKYLFTSITTGDIIQSSDHTNNSQMEVVDDTNVSSQIRRHMFGMPGGTHTKKKKHKRRKMRKRRTQTRKK